MLQIYRIMKYKNPNNQYEIRKAFEIVGLVEN